MRSAVGALLLVVIGSVIFASRRGYLDFEKFLEILYSETITCSFDICVGLGDVAAFMVSVVTYVALDNSLIQILPACWLFLSLAWLGSLYNAYHDAKQLYSVYFQHFKSTKFVDDMSFRNAANIISKARGSGLEHTIAGKALTSHDVRNHLAQHVRLLSNERGKYQVLLELELAESAWRRVVPPDVPQHAQHALLNEAHPAREMHEAGDLSIVVYVAVDPAVGAWPIRQQRGRVCSLGDGGGGESPANPVAEASRVAHESQRRRIWCTHTLLA